MRWNRVFAFMFLALFVADIVAFVQDGPWQYLFWACNHVTLLLAIAFWRRSGLLFTSIASVVFIPQLFWIVDFFVRLTGTQFLGVTEYLFVPDYPAVWLVLSLKHLFLPFVAVWGVRRYGLAKEGLVGAFIYGIALLLVSYALNPNYNINCAYQNCLTGLPIPSWLWTFGYPIVMAGLIWLQFILLKRYVRH
ncbi:hypothetical protein HY493_05165 [Candidatus Woesearchaeota archaeon]|nr:hypothetical protein [Candidatus Woesearchaeota archaeon]